MTMRFPRTYADADGESHFAEVEETFAPIAFVPTNPPLGLSAPRAATAAVFCQLAPDWDGDWHPSPRRQFLVTLSGNARSPSPTASAAALDPGSLCCSRT